MKQRTTPEQKREAARKLLDYATSRRHPPEALNRFCGLVTALRLAADHQEAREREKAGD